MFKKLLAVCLISLQTLAASIQTISSLHEAHDALLSADEETLVVWDVDDVLITSVDVFDRNEALPILLPLVEKALAEGHKQKVDRLHALVTLEAERVLLEPHIPAMIRDLQERGVKTICLTAIKTGALGYIPSIPQWRVDHMRSLGLVFSYHAAPASWFTLSAIEKPGKPPPVYAEGIIASGGYTKGETLEEFLRVTSWLPKKILFFDDRMHNIKSVQQHAERMQIPCMAFHCIGNVMKEEEIDEQLILFQWEYLWKEGVYLNDVEARIKKNSL